MIEIFGVKEGSEYEAALHVRSLLMQLWPDLAQHKEDHVKIVVGLKIYGYKTQDLDLIVIGSFRQPREFAVEYEFYPIDDKKFVPRNAYIRNFALLIEVKSHDATGIRFESNLASVCYKRNGKEHWEDVTEKNRKQVFDFKNFLGRSGIRGIYVQNLILFTGIKDGDLPKRPHNCIAINTSFERWLNVLGQISSPRKTDRNAYINFGAEDVFAKLLSPDFPLFQTLEPTSLDRQRMDRIARNAISETWMGELGNKQIVFRGRGGAGKTVMLLQMAYRVYDQEQRRSMMLTFNRALVADMRRTMALLGVPRNVQSGGIAIETVHAFMRRIMLDLGILKEESDFLEYYEENKEMLLNYLRNGAISPEDIEGLKSNHANEYAWDLIFVDEGQDWPRNEIEILRRIYNPEHVIVSDGIDQFVRDSVADWTTGIDRQDLSVRRLRRCLRMKVNLAHFVMDVASGFGFQDWDIEPNVEAGGGRVIIVEGSLTDNYSLYERLSTEAKTLGNYPVDLLACVPPNLVLHSDDNAVSLPGNAILKHGGKVWDGVSYETREQYPNDREALRIVQYDSCRGLEGWTVLNYAFDDFWTYKYQQKLNSAISPDNLLDTKEDIATNYASRWAMIPLTRAIDTLVINVSNKDSNIKELLRKIYNKRKDFIEWEVLS